MTQIRLSDILSRVLRRRPPENLGDLLQAKGRTLAEAVIQRLIYQALMGDSRSLALIFERLEGKVEEQKPTTPSKIRVEWQLPLPYEEEDSAADTAGHSSQLAPTAQRSA